MSSKRVAAAYLRYGLDTLQRMGFNELAHTLRDELGYIDFNDPDAYVALGLYLKILERMLQVAEPSGFAFEWASRYWLTKHGLLLVGMQACSNLTDAFELAARYLPARMPVYRLIPNITAERLLFTIELSQECSRIREFALITFALECVQALEVLIDDPAPVLEISLDIDEPAYYSRYAAMFPAIHFAAPGNQLSVQLSHVATPRLQYDEPALRLIVRHFQDIPQETPLSVTAQVEALLHSNPLKHAQLDNVAKRLKLSERTLSRRLRAEGTSFRQLLHKTLCQQSAQLLQHSCKSVSELAVQMGYSDTAHFIRAFRQWTGLTPVQYRQQLTRTYSGG